MRRDILVTMVVSSSYWSWTLETFVMETLVGHIAKTIA